MLLINKKIITLSDPETEANKKKEITILLDRLMMAEEIMKIIQETVKVVKAEEEEILYKEEEVKEDKDEKNCEFN
jgi:hypothetical protein